MFIELLLSYFIIIELCLLLTIHSGYRIRICVYQEWMDDKMDNFVISLKEVWDHNMCRKIDGNINNHGKKN